MSKKEISIWYKVFWLVAGFIVLMVLYHLYQANKKQPTNEILLNHLINLNKDVLANREESKKEIKILQSSFDSLETKQQIIIKEQPIHYAKYYNNTVHIVSATDSEHYSYLPNLAATWDSLDRLGVWWDKPKAYRAIPVNNE